MDVTTATVLLLRCRRRCRCSLPAAGTATTATAATAATAAGTVDFVRWHHFFFQKFEKAFFNFFERIQPKLSTTT